MHTFYAGTTDFFTCHVAQNPDLPAAIYLSQIGLQISKLQLHQKQSGSIWRTLYTVGPDVAFQFNSICILYQLGETHAL